MGIRAVRRGPRPFAVAAPLLAAALLVAAPPRTPARAATYQGGETVFFAASSGDDAYLAGGKVVVDGDVAGDALVAAGSVVVNGSVGEDLAAAAGSVVVNGEVGDDLRAAGGDVTITRAVGDDLAAFGGRVTIGTGAAVGGDATVAAGTVVAAGAVAGDARLGGGRIVFTGDVAGDAEFHATQRLEIDGRIGGRARFSAPEVRLGPGASFGGDVEYWTRAGELDFGASPPAGAVRFDPDLRFAETLREAGGKGKAAAGLVGAWLVLSLLAGALTILVLVLLAPGHFGAAADDLRASFWRSFGIGVLYFMATPVAATVLLATIVGIPLGLALLALYLLSLLFAKSLAAVVLARRIERRRERAWSRTALFFAAFGIFVLLKAASLVPLAGWLAVVVLVCAAFGAMAAADWRLLKRLRAPA